MTLAQLKTRVRNWIGEPDTTAVSDDEIEEVLNEAQLHLNLVTKYLVTNATLSFTANQRYESLPSNHAHTLGVVRNYQSSSQIALTFMPYVDYIAMTDRSGTPNYFSENRTWLYLYPKPSSARDVEVFYVRDPEEMSGTDEPEVPEEYHNLLVWFACDILDRKLDEFERAEKWQAKYERGEARMRAIVNSERTNAIWVHQKKVYEPRKFIPFPDHYPKV